MWIDVALDIARKLLSSRTGGDFVLIAIMSTAVTGVVLAGLAHAGYFASADGLDATAGRVSALEMTVSTNASAIQSLSSNVKAASSKLDTLTKRSLEQNIFDQTSAMCRMMEGTEARRQLSRNVTELRAEYTELTHTQYPELDCINIK